MNQRDRASQQSLPVSRYSCRFAPVSTNLINLINLSDCIHYSRFAIICQRMYTRTFDCNSCSSICKKYHAFASVFSFLVASLIDRSISRTYKHKIRALPRFCDKRYSADFPLFPVYWPRIKSQPGSYRAFIARAKCNSIAVHRCLSECNRGLEELDR